MHLFLTIVSGSALALPLATTAPAGVAVSPLVDAAPVEARGADEIVALVMRGKQELLAGQPDAALATFNLANEKNGGALATEAWVLRAQIAIGELDEAFDRIIDLEASGAKAIELDYVIGVARYEMARRAEGERGGAPGGAYQEAAAYLGEATAADAEAFPDAWMMIAASARWIGESEIALAAIDRALLVQEDGETFGLASKIHIAHGAAQMGTSETRAAGRTAIEQGVSEAEAAIKAYGTSKKRAGALADIHLQRAVGLLFLERKSDAASDYTDAMEWDPTQVDYAQLLGLFTDDEGTVRPFVDILQSGSTAFTKRWGADATSDAGLVWWIGYGEYTLGRYEDAIDSFDRALVKYPQFANAYWYIGVSCYFRGKEFDEDATRAFGLYADFDPVGFAAMVNASAENKAYLGRLLGRLYGAGRLEVAASLAEIRLLADEFDPLLWNDVGLMCRDAGESVVRDKIKLPRKPADDYYERSWVAYQRAIELDRKPQYLNDGAVLLHYYLDREPEKAIAMYDEAEEMAVAMLAEGGLSKVEEPIVKIALRDARNNRARLKEKIAKRKKIGGDGAGH